MISLFAGCVANSVNVCVIQVQVAVSFDDHLRQPVVFKLQHRAVSTRVQFLSELRNEMVSDREHSHHACGRRVGCVGNNEGSAVAPTQVVGPFADGSNIRRAFGGCVFGHFVDGSVLHILW